MPRYFDENKNRNLFHKEIIFTIQRDYSNMMFLQLSCIKNLLEQKYQNINYFKVDVALSRHFPEANTITWVLWKTVVTISFFLRNLHCCVSAICIFMRTTCTLLHNYTMTIKFFFYNFDIFSMYLRQFTSRLSFSYKGM